MREAWAGNGRGMREAWAPPRRCAIPLVTAKTAKPTVDLGADVRFSTVGNCKSAKTHGTVGVADSNFLPWVMAKMRKPTVCPTGLTAVFYRW